MVGAHLPLFATIILLYYFSISLAISIINLSIIHRTGMCGGAKDVHLTVDCSANITGKDISVSLVIASLMISSSSLLYNVLFAAFAKI